MTKLRFKVFIMVCIAGISFAASADDRDRRGGFNNGQSGEWRLGNYRDGRGYEILRWTNRGWRPVPGSATAVGDGWVLGTDRRSGGYGIYRWNGRDWDRAPGGAVRIGGSYRQPWVVNNQGERYVWKGRDWDQERGFYRQNSRKGNMRSSLGRDYRESRNKNRRRRYQIHPNRFHDRS